jgi:hypothetical protein
MTLRLEKLTRAHSLLVDWLSDGPVPVASCITWGVEAGLSARTIFEARRRMRIVCDRQKRGSKGRPGEWRLLDITPPPEEWRQRKPRFHSQETTR